MIVDEFGGAHSSNSQASVSSFAGAVRAVAAHQPIGSALTDALKHDPDLIAAHALNGFGQMLLARRETVTLARAISTKADAYLSGSDGVTETESALVESLSLAVNGHLQRAAERLETLLLTSPRQLLAAKLANALRFMSGQPVEMLATTRGLLNHWTPETPGFGFVLGCHAFGLEESGQYLAAEATGRRAISFEADDVWGLHAVSHVMEMGRRTNEGVDLLEVSRPLWPKCNNFKYHLAWHLALFRLEDGDADSVLELFDRDIMPTANDDFRDMANACSLLWRLELENVPVGDRWSALAEIATRRRDDVTYVFGTLHYLLALVASGDAAGADQLIAELNVLARHPTSDQAKVAAQVGVPLAEVIRDCLAHRRGDQDLLKLALRLQSIGGSHAQRDVFLRTLLAAAADRADSAALIGLTRVRNNLRSADRFFSIIEKRRQASASGASKSGPSVLAS